MPISLLRCATAYAVTPAESDGGEDQAEEADAAKGAEGRAHGGAGQFEVLAESLHVEEGEIGIH